MSKEFLYDEHTTAGKEKQLLQEFPTSSYDEWHEAAVKLLKGVPFERRMYTKTYEGISLQPMYRRKDLAGLPYADSYPGFAPYLRGTNVAGYKANSWKVAQTILARTPKEFNDEIRHDLQNGQTAVQLILDDPCRHGLDPKDAPTDDVGTGGVAINTPEDLYIALQGIDLTTTPLFVQAGTGSLSVSAFLAILVQKQGLALENAQGCIGMDPFGMLASEGVLPYSLTTAYKKMAALTWWAHNEALQLKTILIDGSPYHNSGGNAVQELAFVLASAVEYIREMLEAGLSFDAVASRLQFVFSVGTNYFLEIAKLRAARVLWGKVVKAFGGNEESQKMVIHVNTSLWNKTIQDPYVNMLRTTIEAFAGVVGGCESLDVGCFDERMRTPDEFSRRIARNSQTILKEEAHLDEVIDPAGGSWFVEKLTDQLARKTWTLFQSVEELGGMGQALQRGFHQAQVAATAEQRKANLANRKDVLVGTNMYVNIDEKLLEPRESDYLALRNERIDVVANYRSSYESNARSVSIAKLPGSLNSDLTACMQRVIEAGNAGATLGEIEQALHQPHETPLTVTALPLSQAAEMFEQLRATTEIYAQQSGHRPRIFLANMGPGPQHKVRADFSRGFFEVGGFEVLDNQGFLELDDAVRAAISSAAPVVVICSTDESYPELVPPLCKRIKAVQADTIIVLAGYPKDYVDALKEAGVDEFIHLRANLYEVLQRLMKRLDILK